MMSANDALTYNPEDLRDLIDANALLFKAAEKGTAPAIRFALALGADVNVERVLEYCGSEANPLVHAARVGNVGVVEALLDAGADIEHKYIDKTPLMFASEAGHLSTVQTLLLRGANPNAVSREDYKFYHETSLMLAARHGHAEICDELINNGADVNKMIDGFTPAMTAAANGHTNVLQVLHAHGCDFNLRSDPTVNPPLPGGRDTLVRTAESLAASYARRGDDDSLNFILEVTGKPSLTSLSDLARCISSNRVAEYV